MKTSSYDTQAADFLAKHGLKLSLKQGTKECPWSHEGKSGNHYVVTILKDIRSSEPEKGGRIAFDFWGSIADREALEKAKSSLARCQAYEHDVAMRTESIRQHERAIKEATPSAYGVLACISGDVHCPNTFQEFCDEFGYDEDSRKAEKQFKACHAFAQKLRAFFTEQEIEELSEIQ